MPMPYIDPQTKLGINVDRWLVLQSSQQPRQRAARCHGFEKELVECSHGIGRTRALKECRLEMEDFHECMTKNKMRKRLSAIQEQRAKMEKEKTYVPPPQHTGQAGSTP